MKILILGGTTEASVLAQRLAADQRHDLVLSLAGRTASPRLPPVPSRIGGFGGVEGLIRYLQDEHVAAIIDATHPFAAQMSRHAVEAADHAQISLLRLERPAWNKQDGDRWIDVQDMHAAAHALGTAPRRVFLTIGKLEVEAFTSAPQHDYLIRAIDDFVPPATLKRARVMTARGPFGVDDEAQLLKLEQIDIVVSKNSGADATVAKVIAARHLDIPVIMVARPALPETCTVATIEAALAWIDTQHDRIPDLRGA